jgi:hypothetical protein
VIRAIEERPSHEIEEGLEKPALMPEPSEETEELLQRSNGLAWPFFI